MYSAPQTLKPGYTPGRKGKVFCESPFALHRLQLESISKMSTLPPLGNISTDAHACGI